MKYICIIAKAEHGRSDPGMLVHSYCRWVWVRDTLLTVPLPGCTFPCIHGSHLECGIETQLCELDRGANNEVTEFGNQIERLSLDGRTCNLALTVQMTISSSISVLLNTE